MFDVQKIIKKQTLAGSRQTHTKTQVLQKPFHPLNLLRRKAKKMLVPTDKQIIANLLQFTKSSSLGLQRNLSFISQLDKLLLIRIKRLRHFSVLIKHSIKKRRLLLLGTSF